MVSHLTCRTGEVGRSPFTYRIQREPTLLSGIDLGSPANSCTDGFPKSWNHIVSVRNLPEPVTLQTGQMSGCLSQVSARARPQPSTARESHWRESAPADLGAAPVGAERCRSHP